MTNYAVINKETNIVDTVIVWDGKVWDGESGWLVPDGCFTVELEDGSSASAGYTYENGNFTAPPPAEEDEEEKQKQALADNLALKSILLSQATTSITVWQTKLLIGRKLTDAETTALNAWLDYIDELNAIDANTSDSITWPTKPS